MADVKSVTDQAGVGALIGKRMETKGFDKAYVILGKFLLIKKNNGNASLTFDLLKLFAENS